MNKLSGFVLLFAVVVLVSASYLTYAKDASAVSFGKATISGCEVRCSFALVDSRLEYGKWVVPPTQSGDSVSWQTAGNPPPGNEAGYVEYKGEGGAMGEVRLAFYNPVLGSNTCAIVTLSLGNFSGSCDAGGVGWRGVYGEFTYTFHVHNK